MPETDPNVVELPKRFHFEPLALARVARAAVDAPPAGTDGDGDQPSSEPDNDDDDVFHVILSSETPCDGYLGSEVLSHSAAAIDMSIARTGLTTYLDHGGYPYRPTPDPALRIGFVSNITRNNETRELEGDLRFASSPLAQQSKQDALNGTLRFGSMRAYTSKRKVTRSNDPNTPDQVTYTRWRPEEWSLVGIPADPTSGIARSAGIDLYPVVTESDTDSPNPSKEESTMPEQDTPVAAATPAAPPATVTRQAAPPAEVVRLCAAHGVPQAKAAEYIERGLSVGEVKSDILDGRTTRSVAAGAPSEVVDLSAVPKKDRVKFSVARAITNMTLEREGTGKFDGFEAEISAEIARQTPMSYKGIGGRFLPLSLLTPEERWERNQSRIARAMGSGVAGGGAELVFDTRGDLIELLVAHQRCAQMGAQTLLGLTGPIQFPAETGEPTAYLVGENMANSVTQTQLNFVTRVLSPKEAIAQVPFPRRLLNLAAVDIESRVRVRLLSKHARLWDKLMLHGSGANGEPFGIYNCPGVSAVSFGGAPTGILPFNQLSGAVADANVDEDTSMGFLTTPLMAAKLKSTLDFGAVAGARPIWQGKYGEGEMAGYKAMSTNQVSKTLGTGGDEHGIVFGDWSQAVFGHWGALEFIVDTVSAAGKGQIIITTNELGDALVERPEAFAVATGAKIA